MCATAVVSNQAGATNGLNESIEHLLIFLSLLSFQYRPFLRMDQRLPLRLLPVGNQYVSHPSPPPPLSKPLVLTPFNSLSSPLVFSSLR